MGTASLKLPFIITLMFTMVDLRVKDNERSCSFTPKQVNIADVQPKIYNISLIIQPHQKNMSGKSDITIYIKKPTINISLHARNLIIHSQCIKLGSNRITSCEQNSTYRFGALKFCAESDILSLFFFDVIPSGEHILHIEYTSIFDSNLLKVNFPTINFEYQNRWLITNLHEPNATRAIFPCWDDPTVRTHYSISIWHEKPCTIFTNVPTYEPHFDYFKQWRNFATHDMMSTHSLAIAMVCDVFKSGPTIDIHNIWLQIYAAEAVQSVKFIAADMLLYFKYNAGLDTWKSMRNIDHVVISNSPMKSMGRPGLIIYRETDVSYYKNIDFPGRIIDVSKLVAYEMARQLFVGYVGSSFNSDWWINEILASFYSYYILEQYESEELRDLFVVQNIQTALDSDIFLELQPIIYKAKNDLGIDGLLYSLLYQKRAYALVHMLVHLVTPENFKLAIRNYIRTDGTKNFWTFLQEVYPQKSNNTCIIKEIIDSWLTEKHYPEIIFTRNYTEQNVEYRLSNSTQGFKCKIPITYTAETYITTYQTSDISWYDERETKYITVPKSLGIFLVNMEYVGYYRVNYDQINWQYLAVYLLEEIYDPIPPINRAQIVNDAFYFTKKGKIKTAVFFQIIQFLKNDENYVVWYPMFNILSNVRYLLETPYAVYVKPRITDILDGIILKVGYKIRPYERNIVEPLRLLATKWACILGHTGCRHTTAEKLIPYIYNKASKKITWSVNWLYTIGMMSVNMSVWTKLLNDSRQQKNMKLLEYLTYSEDEEIILHYLDLMLNTDLGNQSELRIGKIYASVVKKHVGKNAVLNYVLENYNKAMNRFPDDFRHMDLMGNIIMNLRQMVQIAKVETFIHTTFSSNSNKKLRNIFQVWSNSRKNQLLRMVDHFKYFILVEPI